MSFKKVDERVSVPQSVEVETARVVGFAWGVATAVCMLIGDASRGEGRAPVEKYYEDCQRTSEWRNEKRGGVRPQGSGDSIKKQKEQTGQKGMQVMCHRCKKMGHHGRNFKKCFTYG